MAQNLSWPKTYLLQLYQEAVAQGCIRVKTTSREQARSLSYAFIRFRRRQDRHHEHVIRPEYHLCSTFYEKDKGTLLIMYDKMPDGAELPSFDRVTDTSQLMHPSFQKPPGAVAPSEPQLPLPDFSELDREEGLEPNPDAPFNSEEFMKDLLKGVHFEGEE